MGRPLRGRPDRILGHPPVKSGSKQEVGTARRVCAENQMEMVSDCRSIWLIFWGPIFEGFAFFEKGFLERYANESLPDTIEPH